MIHKLNIGKSFEIAEKIIGRLVSRYKAQGGIL